MTKKIIPLFLMFAGLTCYASEVDSFTGRYDFLPDATGVIETKMNELFADAVKKADEAGKGCDSKRLYGEIRAAFGSQRSGLKPYLLQDAALAAYRRVIRPRDSIYRGFTLLNSGALILATDAGFPGFGVVFQIGPHVVGSDKLAHFTNVGWKYFVLEGGAGGSPDRAISYGEFTERTALGLMASGVYSYGDLSANFTGMRFWNHILQERDDVLGAAYNLGPYVRCESGHWLQVKRLNLNDYVDGAWDEGINCSKFVTQAAADVVRANLAEMERRAGKGLQCPVDPGDRDQLRVKYGPWASRLINTDGHVKH